MRITRIRIDPDRHLAPEDARRRGYLTGYANCQREMTLRHDQELIELAQKKQAEIEEIEQELVVTKMALDVANKENKKLKEQLEGQFAVYDELQKDFIERGNIIATLQTREILRVGVERQTGDF